MINRILFSLIFALSFFTFSVFAQTAQTASADSNVLIVGGETAQQLKLTKEDLAKLPRQTVSAKDHDGVTYTFEGVSLFEILKAAGVEFGEKLRGKSLALYLTVEASDGYKAVFALPELDPAFAEKTIILSENRDGKPLSEKEGNWRVIVPGEKRQARWVRQVTALTIRRAS